MFAYCLNNPINRIDESGTAGLWGYLIIDHDMGFVHRAVVDHIEINNSGVETEVHLSVFGRADVVHEAVVWEVKHAGSNPAGREALATAQALSYVCFNPELNALGAAGAFSGEFYVFCSKNWYMVSYKTPAPGVILYTVQDAENHNGEAFRAYVPKAEKEKNQSSELVGNPGFVGVPFVIGGVAGGPMGFPNQDFRLL